MKDCFQYIEDSKRRIKNGRYQISKDPEKRNVKAKCIREALDNKYRRIMQDER